MGFGVSGSQLLLLAWRLYDAARGQKLLATRAACSSLVTFQATAIMPDLVCACVFGGHLQGALDAYLQQAVLLALCLRATEAVEA